MTRLNHFLFIAIEAYANAQVMGNSLVPRLENAEKTGILQLSGLKITKIPDTVKNLSNIRSLDLSTNKLEVLKPWIGRLKLLKVLNVENNKLHYFPAELCLLTKLETLNASRNLLTSLIMPGHVTNFANMQNLRFIHLSSNSLTEFPVELCSASIPINLLDLSDNQIGLIPSCVASIQVRYSSVAPKVTHVSYCAIYRLPSV
ncbi:Leucine-rich repeat-containing protein 57 [Fasciola gigantica]|uniref:Leucine-rich repeat-containing protein 57 n=1 Tax=Fasciola gigantica TaxID=46835 RepID=A0A504YYA4_FASGI|nr:Leucine-rich repeat-containing protein 57 [Fasciola gigantica]